MSRPLKSTAVNSHVSPTKTEPPTITRYHTVDVDGLKLFYREAGASEAAALLLLHGFPTSSHMYRDLIPTLADRYRVVAPDLPGFGFTEAPERKRFKYTFAHLAEVIEHFTEAIGLNRYALYVFDYGAPIGFRRSSLICSATTRAMSRSIRNSRSISGCSGRRCSPCGAGTIPFSCPPAPRRSDRTIRIPDAKNRDHAQKLRQQGIVVVELDVTSDTSVGHAVDEVLAEAGRIDVLINNAGIASAGITEAFTADQAKVVFNTNIVGLLRTNRAVLPTMRARGDGLIINIGSILGRVTFPFFGIYGASKFALEALTDSLRYEVSELGVDVVLVQPSAYPTNMYAAMQQPADAPRVADYGDIAKVPGKMFEAFRQRFASADAPDPHDVAAAIAKVIAMPKGGRPARVVVGQAFGADAVNDAVAPIQRQVIETLGLGPLALKPVEQLTSS